MSETRVTLQKLEGDAVYLLRVYGSGIEPIEPNPYKFCVTALVMGRMAVLLGLHHAGGTISDYRQIKRQLKTVGVSKICWTHSGKLTKDSADLVKSV